ncbi:MAG: hypothetical protein M1828_003294 [Chrysothrix sp. TS-e1954]|nr:MAG: hypothetical protein M1828_003294 [Chrysothrix sp. TS-e1954]
MDAQSSQAKSSKRSSTYPNPIVHQSPEKHLHSLVLLHGRGSNGTRFGEALLATSLPNGKTLQKALPNTKIVLPTASKRRSTVLKRTPINQWFDNYSLEEPNIKQHLQVEGLRETIRFVHGQLEEEIKVVGAHNVALGGLSQGSAAALFALLMWPHRRLAGFVGMSGWLPFEDVLREDEGDDVDDGASSDFFEEVSDQASDEHSPKQDLKAAERMRPKQLRSLETELDLGSDSIAEGTDQLGGLDTPVFLGHGADDPKVSPDLGAKAVKRLRTLGCDVEWHLYNDLAHWYNGEELQDLVTFLIAHAEKLRS